MCVSFTAAYFVVRKSASPKNNGNAPAIHDKNDTSNKPFPNLPVSLSGTYEEETSDFTADTNDYLVISEGTLVTLYAIDKDEKKTFERVLDIDLAALKPEDKALLKKGILLNDKSSVISLIEDFSS